MPSRNRRKLAKPIRRPPNQVYKRISKFFTFPLLLVFIVPVFLAVGSIVFVAQKEENDAFCASCHTQPESTYYQRALAAGAVDLASSHVSHSTKCIDCHSGHGLLGRLSAIALGGRNALALITKTDIQPAPLTVPITDSTCIKCHSNTESETDFNHHFHAYLLRWQAVDPNAAKCVDCHSAHNTDGDSSQMFLNTQRAEGVCQRCHSVLRSGG